MLPKPNPHISVIEPQEEMTKKVHQDLHPHLGLDAVQVLHEGLELLSRHVVTTPCLIHVIERQLLFQLFLALLSCLKIIFGVKLINISSLPKSDFIYIKKF